MPDDVSPESRPVAGQQWLPGWYPDPWAQTTGAIRWWDGATWTAAVQVPQRPQRPDEPAGWWWRALALFLDSVFVSIATSVVSLPAQLGLQRALREEQELLQQGLDEGRAADAFGDYWTNFLGLLADRWVWLFALPVLVAAAYHVVMLRTRGATLGKLMLGMRVVPAEGEGRLSWWSAARRVLVQLGPGWVFYPVAILSGSLVVVLGASLVVAVFSLVDHLWAAGVRRRTLHDLAAGTRVLRGPGSPS